MKNTKNIKFNNTILTFFLTIQCFTLYNYINISVDNEFWQHTEKEYYVEKILGTEFPKPVNKKVNQYNVLVEFIKNSYEKNSENKIILALSDSPFPIERYHMKFICKIHMIHCDFLPFKSFKKNNLDLLSENYQILLVSSKKSNLDISNDIATSIKNNLSDSLKTSSPVELYSMYLHYLYASNNLAMYKLNVEKCETFYKDFSACLISKNREKINMNLNSFDYVLPKENIAQKPTDIRTDSKLLVLSKKDNSKKEDYFYNLLNHISSKDLIIFNNTKVIPARIFGLKDTGARVEIL